MRRVRKSLLRWSCFIPMAGMVVAISVAVLAERSAAHLVRSTVGRPVADSGRGPALTAWHQRHSDIAEDKERL